MICNEKKLPLVILTGPTAVGKTDISIKLAKSINAQIISADSMQVYTGMDIGSAKITKEEMQGVKHHLIDCLSPKEDFNVFRFCELAKESMKSIYENGQIPMIVGGTGFYIQALLYDVDFSDEPKESPVRKQLEEDLQTYGALSLHERLKEIDPESALAIHPNNSKRVIRALEYYLLTGKKISSHNEEAHQKASPYDFIYFVLDMDRKKLYERIDKRVDIMLNNGLVCEVTKLKELGLTKKDVSMQGIGYKEILMYLDGEISLDEAVCRIKRDSRHFAKRQLTWFRREKDVTWIQAEDKEQAFEKMLSLYHEKLD